MFTEEVIVFILGKGVDGVILGEGLSYGGIEVKKGEKKKINKKIRGNVVSLYWRKKR